MGGPLLIHAFSRIAMKHRSWFALAAISAVFSAGTAAAQHEAPAAPSAAHRFVVGMHLTGTTIPAGPHEASSNRGGGAGLTLGYRLDDRLTLFARSTMAYRSGHVDLGARYRFGARGAALRPYVEVAATRAASSSALEVYENGLPVEGTRHTRGMGFTAGAGVEYAVTRTLGIDVGMAVSRGSFSTGEFRGEEFAIDERFTTARINVGLTWRP
jgi:opacity protein-like surface antigen